MSAQSPPRPGGTMNTGIRSVGRHSAVFMLGTMLSKLTGFLMLPIYTRFLSPADYGVLELLQMTIDLVGLVAGMSIAGAVFRFYHDTDDHQSRHRLLSTAALGIAVMAAVSGAVGLAASGLLQRTLLAEHGTVLYFQIFFFAYFFGAVEGVPLLYLRVLERSATVVAINLAKLLLTLSLNIYLVVHLGMGVTGVLVSNLAASAVVSVGLSVFFFGRVGFGFSLPRFLELARYGYPLAAGSLANFFLVFSDRYFLNHYATTADVGIYSLAYKFAFVLSAFAYGPFMMAWGPQRFAVAKRADAADIFRRVFLYLNIALGGLALCIALYAPDVIRTMAAWEFRGAGVYVPALLAAQIVMHWTTFHSFGLQIGKTTGTYAVLSVVGIATVLLLNFLFIPRFAIIGAIYATTLAYWIRFLLVHRIAQRRFPVDYAWGRILVLYAIAGGAVAARLVLGELQLHVSLIVNALLMISAGYTTFRLVLSGPEQADLKQLLSRMLPAPRRSQVMPARPE